jgi:hypothetical protein
MSLFQLIKFGVTIVSLTGRRSSETAFSDRIVKVATVSQGTVTSVNAKFEKKDK